MGSFGKDIDKWTGGLFDHGMSESEDLGQQAIAQGEAKAAEATQQKQAAALQQQAEEQNRRTQLSYIASIRSGARGSVGGGTNQTLGG